MVAGSVMVAGVAVFGCFMMATMASVSAQQIGNLQGQGPPRSKLTVSASAWRETPYGDCFLCQTLCRDDHIMRFYNDEST